MPDVVQVAVTRVSIESEYSFTHSSLNWAVRRALDAV